MTSVPTLKSIQTASGERVSGVRHVLANTRFSPNFTRRIAYGVLDLPGTDGILGIGFLNKFLPNVMVVENESTKSISFTVPHSGQVVNIKAITPVTVTSQIPVSKATTESEPHCLSMQWEPPSAQDLEDMVAQLQLCYDPVTRSATLMLDGNFDSENPAQWLDGHLSPEVAEGAVFLAGHDKSVIDILAQTPETHREKLQQLLQQFQDSVFKECEFPPFPPHSDVEFKIQLEQGAQIPAAGVHKLSPALVEQLRVMLQELLHNGLIVPTCS